MSDAPNEPILETQRRRPVLRLSLAWLVPLIALAISLSIAWRSYSDRGPLIEIVFDSAAGITAGETLVKYRDFTIGIVENTELSEDLRTVIASVRLDKESGQWVDANARFWLVRAQVGPQGVSGLDTIVGGAYIEADLDAERGPPQTRFVALREPPLTPIGTPGLRVFLRASQGGSVSVGAPVLFKRISVGKIEDVTLSERGDVLITAFIDAPYDAAVTSATRFWNASGFQVNLGAGGATLNVESLAALLQGGVSYDTVTSGGAPVEQEHTFQLFSSEEEARVVILNDDPDNQIELMSTFESSVRGLAIGAAVEYRGIQVGRVTEIQAEVVRVDGEPVVNVRATMSLNPSRFGLPLDDQSRDATLELLATSVERGLRARLATGNILTSSLFVELVELPDAPPAVLDLAAQPFPELPSVAQSGGGFAASAEGVLARIEALPVEELMDSVTTLMASANVLITDERVRTAPENLGLLLADLRALVSDSGLKEIPAEITGILASVRAVTDELARQEIAAGVAGVIEATRTAVEGVPEALAQFSDLSGEVAALPLDELVVSASAAVDAATELLRGEDIQQIPAAARASIAELELLLADLRGGGAVANVNASLASLRRLTDDLAEREVAAGVAGTLDAATRAIESVTVTTDRLPAVLDELAALSAEARALPLSELTASATTMIDEASALIGSEGVAQAPVALDAALGELRGLLAEIREGGALENVNATLASIRSVTDELAAARLTESLRAALSEAEGAATSVNAASAELPALIESLRRVSDQAAAVPLDELVASATASLAAAEALIASDELRDLPPRLGAALDEVAAILAELRAGGAVENVNGALASADAAAAAINAATADLPALVGQLSRVAARADATLGAFGPGSEINRDTLLLLRELRETSRSVNALVTALERRPNSVLFGR